MKKLANIIQFFAAVMVLLLASCGSDDDSNSNPAPKPVASFTVTNGGCIGPCTVTFTNTSQHATTYIWNFGDGTATSALANPTHEYTVAGTYTVTLTASSATETSSTTKTVIIASVLPVASFTFENDGCEGPCVITFTNTSLNATSYSWNFGDGSSASTVSNPTHQYTTAGTYTVTLTATGTNGTHTTSETITISQSQFYITYKADGADVSLTEVFGERDILSNPRRLFVRGSGAAGAHPTFKFQTMESFIGFDPGLNIGCHENTLPNDYVEITKPNGTLYSTANDEDGIYVFFQEVSYTNGGVIKGTFSGSAKTATGAVTAITEGKFRVKFNN